MVIGDPALVVRLAIDASGSGGVDNFGGGLDLLGLGLGAAALGLGEEGLNPGLVDDVAGAGEDAREDEVQEDAAIYVSIFELHKLQRSSVGN